MILRNKVIYILRLESGKYYVGKSGNITKRFTEHFKGKGAIWTRKYKPLQVIDILENESLFTEDNVTKELMLKYGIPHVRGGAYSQVELTECDLYCLNKELRGVHDVCYKCGGNHFINKCKI